MNLWRTSVHLTSSQVVTCIAGGLWESAESIEQPPDIRDRKRLFGTERWVNIGRQHARSCHEPQPYSNRVPPPSFFKQTQRAITGTFGEQLECSYVTMISTFTKLKKRTRLMWSLASSQFECINECSMNQVVLITPYRSSGLQKQQRCRYLLCIYCRIVKLGHLLLLLYSQGLRNVNYLSFHSVLLCVSNKDQHREPRHHVLVI